MRPNDYQPFSVKVTKWITYWIVCHISFTGRIQLIQSVLYSLINFWTKTFPLSKDVLSALEKICSAFLCSGTPNSARGANIAWESSFTPKEVGGHGLRRLAAWNNVFVLKLIWLLFVKSWSLWVSWVKKKCCWEVGRSKIMIVIMMEDGFGRDCLNFVCQIGSGSSLLFWHDDWTSLGPLIDIIGANGPRVTDIPWLTIISQAIANGVWCLPREGHLITLLLRTCLPSSPSDLSSDQIYCFLWWNLLTSPPAQFSSSHTWHGLHPPATLVPWFCVVWFSQKIPKHVFLQWIVVRDILWNHDRLLSLSLQVPSSCLLCNSGSKNRGHLFFGCSYANAICSAFLLMPSLVCSGIRFGSVRFGFFCFQIFWV